MPIQEKQEVYITETLDRKTKADIKQTVGKIVVSICNIFRMKPLKDKSIVKEAFNTEVAILYGSVSYLSKKHFKGKDMRNYRKFIEKCLDGSKPIIESLLNYNGPLSDIVDVHDLASICANIFDDTKLCFQCMTMTDGKKLLKVLKL